MKSMRKIVSVLLALCLLAFSGAALAATDISDGTVTAEGIGRPEDPMRRTGAKIDAYRILAEQVHGVQIDAETTVSNAIVSSDVVNARVSGVIKGAKITSEWADERGFYHVVMALPVYGGAGSLAAAVLPQVPQQGFLPPSDIVPVDGSYLPNGTAGNTSQASGINPNQATLGSLYGATGQYTGLIVDCTGLGLQTAMAPVVYTEGNKMVYGIANFTREQVINRGCVGYSHSVDSGVSRAGSNPMIVRAESVERFVNPVISKEDAARILAENQMNGFLSTANVVFVR